ncbi:hypothetical protein EDD37DRAFT_75118 [Exophiala viscosa]|uniref:Phosphatidylglycerol lysyltransferase C-terminal domain-containing protein n=1 Tax=Exophiala viscosa TaxID=2486360 RepID=A0AAN6E1L2_9EURO|nr:hypothetical protein EDD36DRAFT_137870 [Exophiala viscosa]KAI1629916.1 hypothetical protein EDD37DRAFT_75118 [Exophiala viscosa]
MASLALDPAEAPQGTTMISQKETITVTVDSASDRGVQVHEESTVTSMKETVIDPESTIPVHTLEKKEVTNVTEVTPVKPKKEKKAKENKQKAPTKPEVPFYEALGKQLFKESRESTFEDHHAQEHAAAAVEANPTAAKSKPTMDLLSPPRPVHRRTGSSNSEGYASDNSISTGSMSDIEAKDPSVNVGLKDSLYNLEDYKRLEAMNELIAQYSTVSHMSVRDPSYSFWINKTRTAAIHFKLLNKVAVLAGDPLCTPSAMPSVLEEFGRYCKKARWKISIIGASEHMLEIAKRSGWPVMRFGTEKVLNPTTNEVLLGKSGKRTVAQCRQLLDATKGGLSLHVYVPANGRDIGLETELTRIYDEWRGDRNTTRDNQAFITVFDMFSMPSIMTFIYTTTKEGAINGFAALRKMGTDSTGAGRYHIDPFIQSVNAPRGTSDLLIFASLAYLNADGATYLGLGHEPVSEPDAMWNMHSLVTSATRRVYRHIFGRLPVGGKETFNSRWKPDTEQEAGLYLIFIGRKTPSPKHLLAMTHFANISLRNVLRADWKDFKQELRMPVPVQNPDLMLYAGAAAPVRAPKEFAVPAERPKIEHSVSAPAKT